MSLTLRLDGGGETLRGRPAQTLSSGVCHQQSELSPQYYDQDSALGTSGVKISDLSFLLWAMYHYPHLAPGYIYTSQ